MKRRGVFAALAAVVGLKAECWRICDGISASVTSEPAVGCPSGHIGEAGDAGVTVKPNECPVCGKMAEPYKPTPAPFCGDSMVMMPDGRNVSGCDKALLPMERVTRCRNCNAAFWQDAEK
jgi:hypothetical protein